MRVLQLVETRQRRGAEIFAFQLGDELRRQGHEATTAYLYPFSGTSPLPVERGDVELAAKKTHLLERLPGAQPDVVKRLRALIHEGKPDIVQVNGARTVKYGALLRRLDPKGPWALIYRNIGNPADWVRGVGKRVLFKHGVFPSMDGIVSISDQSADVLRDVFAVEQPMEVIPGAISPPFLEPRRSRAEVRAAASTAEDATVVLFVGSLGPEKRIDRLLRAARTAFADAPKAVLWIVGDGALRDDLKGKAESLGIAARVRFLGATDDVASYYNAADLFTLTSDTEGIPGVLLEAAYFGLPTLATRVGGVAECVDDRHTGMLVDRDDSPALTQTLTLLVGDPGLRKRLGDAGRAWVSTHFLMPAVASRYVKFYQRVLASRGAS